VDSDKDKKMSTESEPASANKPERALPSAPPPSAAPPSSPSSGETETAWRDTAPAPSPRTGRFALFLALLALLALAALAYAGWLGWQRLEVIEARSATAAATQQGMEDELALLARRLEEQRKTVSGQAVLATNATAAVEGLERRLDETVVALGDELRAELRETLDGATRPALVPVDIERLLLIANDAATLARDPDIALEALRIADRRLAALDDPIYAETRRLLAEETAALEGARRPDVAGAAHALSALQSLIPELRSQLRTAAARDGGADVAAAGDDGAVELPLWRRLANDVVASLRELVVLRRTGADDKPLPPPGLEELAAQNLHLRLEAARIALLGRDIESFRTSLGSLDTWLRSWYHTDQPAVATMLQQIERIAALDLSPSLPDISGSLAALREAMVQRGSGPVYGDDLADEPGAEEIPPEPVAPADDSGAAPGSDTETP